MILHIIPNEKFTLDYMKRVHRLFEPGDHYFWILENQFDESRFQKTFEESYFCVDKISFKSYSVFAKIAKKADVIILHSLFFDPEALLILAWTVPRVKSAICWVIWGGDLYDAHREFQAKSFTSPRVFIREMLRKKIISRVDFAITEGDFGSLNDMYKTHARQIAANYTYDFIKPEPVLHDKMVNVMVGHSATVSCRHIETFKLLKSHVGKIRVHCPLSYPNNREYTEQVIQCGSELFGSDFRPITEYLEYDQYVELLNTMDIAIFNNNRQQGMGNITNLLYLGKKVYLSEDNAISNIYMKDKYSIFDCDEIEVESFLIPLTPEDASINRENILLKFSDQNFEAQWKLVFQGGN